MSENSVLITDNTFDFPLYPDTERKLNLRMEDFIKANLTCLFMTKRLANNNPQITIVLDLWIYFHFKFTSI